VRGLPTRRGDQGERKGKGSEEPEDAQPDLKDDQVADVLVGRARDRPRGVSETFEVIAVRMRSRSARRAWTVLAGAQLHAGHEPALEQGRPVRVRSFTSRRSCFSWPRTPAPEARRSSPRRRRR
jgi:hypothetical protein